MSGSTPDAAQLAAMLERHQRGLTAFVRLRMGPALAARESSSDIVQSVCREFLGAGDRFEYRSEDRMRGWLYTAALRKVLQKARHHRAAARSPRREVQAQDSDLSHADLLSAYSSCVTPRRDASAREEVERFERAFVKLSEPHRDVISLVKIAGLPHAEVAAQLETTIEGSRALLRRALVRLSEFLTTED